MGQLLRESTLAAPVVKKGAYDYFIHPLTDGVPQIDPRVLTEVTDEILAIGNFRADKIVTAEAMGIPIGTALSLRTGLPLSVIRKRSYGLPGEVSVAQTTGYSANQLFINGIRSGDRIVFVDDVISTGGTLSACLEALTKMGAELADVIVIFEKGNGRRLVEERFRVSVKTLLRVAVRDGKVELEPLA